MYQVWDDSVETGVETKGQMDGLMAGNSIFIKYLSVLNKPNERCIYSIKII